MLCLEISSQEGNIWEGRDKGTVSAQGKGFGSPTSPSLTENSAWCDPEGSDPALVLAVL